MFIGEWEEQSEKVQRILTQGLLDSYKTQHPTFSMKYGNDSEKHLFECEKATAKLKEAHDGFYGCDTGCEYYTLEGTISCPHGYSEEYDASGFGEMYWYFDLGE